MLERFWNWLLSPAFVVKPVDEVAETRDFLRRLNEAKMDATERRLNRSWNSDPNWR